MSHLFEQYKQWRSLTDSQTAGNEADMEYGDKKAFMHYARLNKLDNDDFEELELQYDEYLIELETE